MKKKYLIYTIIGLILLPSCSSEDVFAYRKEVSAERMTTEGQKKFNSFSFIKNNDLEDYVYKHYFRERNYQKSTYPNGTVLEEEEINILQSEGRYDKDIDQCYIKISEESTYLGTNIEFFKKQEAYLSTVDSKCYQINLIDNTYSTFSDKSTLEKLKDMFELCVVKEAHYNLFNSDGTCFIDGNLLTSEEISSSEKENFGNNKKNIYQCKVTANRIIFITSNVLDTKRSSKLVDEHIITSKYERFEYYIRNVSLKKVDLKDYTLK